MLGSDRLRATGPRWPSSAGSAASVSFRAEPAAGEPYRRFPTRLSWIARRVGGLNVWKISSNCTGTCVWEIGSVPPSANTLGGVALVQVDVFGSEHRQRQDRGRRVDRHVSVLARQLQRQLRADRPVGQADRCHPRDQPDPVAALAHVAADGQVRAAGDVDLELPGGNERESACSRCRPGIRRPATPARSPPRPARGCGRPIGCCDVSWVEQVAQEPAGLAALGLGGPLCGRGRRCRGGHVRGRGTGPGDRGAAPGDRRRGQPAGAGARTLGRPAALRPGRARRPAGWSGRAR